MAHLQFSVGVERARSANEGTTLLLLLVDEPVIAGIALNDAAAGVVERKALDDAEAADGYGPSADAADSFDGQMREPPRPAAELEVHRVYCAGEEAVDVAGAGAEKDLLLFVHLLHLGGDVTMGDEKGHRDAIGSEAAGEFIVEDGEGHGGPSDMK